MLGEPDKSFWRAQLASLDPISGLPGMLLAGGGRAQVFEIAVSGENQALVARLAKNAALGEMVVMVSALSALLHRYCEEDTICLFSPGLGGWSAEPAVPLVVRIAASGALRDHILGVREVVSQSYAHQGEVTGIDWHSDPAATGLRILVSHGGLHAPFAAVDEARFGLRIRIDPKTLALRLEDPDGILPKVLGEAIGGHFNHVLAQFQQPDAPFKALRVLTPEEEHEQLVEFVDTADAELAALPTLPAIFEGLVQQNPDQIALIMDDRKISRSSVNTHANALAQCLVDRFDIGVGDTVAVLSDRSDLVVIALLGVLKAGGVHMALSDQHPAARIGQMLKDAQARVVLCHSSYLELVTDVATCPIFALDLQLGEPAVPVANLPPSVTPDDLASLVFTSGSEGHPKGVAITHAGLANVAMDHVRFLGITGQDRYLQFMARAFDGALLDIFTALFSDAALVMVSDETLADIEAFQDYMDRTEVSLITITPTYLALLDPARMGRVRAIISAAETARGPDAERHASERDFYNGYGPSEAAVNTTLHKVEPDRAYPAVPVGSARANKQVYVLDPHQRPKPKGTLGEIAISGLGLTSGYLNDNELTARKFITHPFGQTGKLYLSGDLGGWNERGELMLHGRKDQQVKLRGYRVEPEEINRVLRSHQETRDSTVLVDQREGRILAFVILEPSGQGAGILDHARAHLPTYMVPSVLHYLDAFPLTPNGKIDTRALMALADQTKDLPRNVAPATATEAMLAEIWASVLEVPEVDCETDFFQLGGDSIRMIQVAHQARQRGLELDTFAIMTHRTIRTLDAYLHASKPNAPQPLCLPLDLAELTPQETDALPKSGVEDAFAASRMQELMLERYVDPDWAALGTYHCLASWRLRDDALWMPGLESAIAGLFQRHPTLRTVFCRPGSGRLIQIVREMAEVPLHVTDLRSLDADAQQHALSQMLNTRANERFDLGDPDTPLVRFDFLQLSGTTCQFVLTLCHAIIDGWSAVELENDLFDCYRQLQEDGTLPEVPSRNGAIKEFVALEQEILDDPVARDFWQERLDTLPLPAILRGAVNKKTGFEMLERPVPAALSGRIDSAVQSASVSLKSVCFATFCEALAKLTGRNAISVGVLVNGRSDRMSDPLHSTGLFWNVVPFAAQAGQPILKVHDALTDMDMHARFPLSEIAAMAGRDELFDACFNFIQFHNERPPGPNLMTEDFQAVDRLHFPLTFVLSAQRNGGALALSQRVEFNRAAFDKADVETLMHAFETQVLTLSPKEA